MPVLRAMVLYPIPRGSPKTVLQKLSGVPRAMAPRRVVPREVPADPQPLLRPMAGVVTRGVQPGHPALDIACFEGTPVRAAHDGQGRSLRSHTHGNVFVLRAADGLETSYAHLQSTKVAGPYKRGDVIGTCGNTGAWTTGPHLHFESNQPERLLRLSDT